MQFRKSLAKYYRGWHQQCLASVEYCKKQGQYDIAADYLMRADEYFKIIEENKSAIDFFSIGDNAFLIDSALPEEFRGFQ